MDGVGNPTEYAQFDATENRIWVPINKMPANLKNAFVAIEDKRFFEHSLFRRSKSIKFCSRRIILNIESAFSSL